jgi:hypothetical protein
MPRKHKKNKSKRMRGGFSMGSMNPFGSSTGTDSGTGWFGSLKKSASSSGTGWFSSTPTTTPAAAAPPPAPAAPPPAPAAPPPAPTPVSGGRKRRSHRMRGGYSDNMSTTNLAASAGSFSGSTARAQAYVGGRTKKRCHKHKRSHRRHCRK